MNADHNVEKKTGLKQSLLETFKGLDTKNKTMVIGGVVLVFGILLSFSGSVNTGNIGETFPQEASVKEQCHFIGEYERSLYRAAVEGASAEDILELMNNDIKDPEEFKHSPAQYFYKIKQSSIRKVDNLVAKVTGEKFQSKSGSEQNEKIDYRGKRLESECLAGFNRSK